MTTFRRILFPVEFSPECQLAASHVAAWARRFDAAVIMMHVEFIPTMYMEGMVWEPQTDLLRDQLRGFLSEVFRDIRVERVLRSGDPVSEIARYIRNEGADLVMMPTHGWGAFRRFLIGSVAAKVLHDVPCPVWTAAHLAEGLPVIDPEIRNVLCAVDLDNRGVHTLRYAGAFARLTNAKLTVAHVVPFADDASAHYLGCDIRRDLISAARERLAVMQQEAEAVGVPCVGAGNVAQFIGHAAKQHKADLVVIGRGGPGLLQRLRTHDYAIIRECGCPVLSL